jgi:hypothetical protein
LGRIFLEGCFWQAGGGGKEKEVEKVEVERLEKMKEACMELPRPLPWSISRL